MRKEDSHCIYLSVILIDSVFKMGKNYYPQVFLEEGKYIVKERKVRKFIYNDLVISPEKFHKKDSDKEDFNEE